MMRLKFYFPLSFLSGILICLGFSPPAQSAIFSSEIAAACGLSEVQFLNIEEKNHLVFEREVLAAEWLEICRSLREAGFKSPGNLLARAPGLLIIRVAESFSEKIESLESMGFKNPIKMIESFPPILGLRTAENIEPKLQALIDLGFKNPIKMIETFPSILGFSTAENIGPKLQSLKDLGFRNPTKMIESSPTILGYSTSENIAPKFEALKNLGFRNPIKMVESAPQILGFSTSENIEPKLQALKDLGFKDPIKMIESLPAILSYSMSENIEPKLKHFSSVWDFSRENVEVYVILIGASLGRITPMAAWLQDMGFEPSSLPRILKIKAIKSLRLEDIQQNLHQAGFTETDSAEARNFLRDPKNWKSLFRKAPLPADCEEALKL